VVSVVLLHGRHLLIYGLRFHFLGYYHDVAWTAIELLKNVVTQGFVLTLVTLRHRGGHWVVS
jgi:hypothetical protein